MCQQKSEMEKAIEFHGHLCPPIVFGIRASEVGLKKLLAKRPEDEEVVAIVENDSCMVDGIQSASGCTLGKGNLILRNYGKMAVTFANRATKEAIRLRVNGEVIDNKMGSSDLGRARRQGNLSKEGMMKLAGEFSHQMMRLSDEELFEIKEIHIEIPEPARIFRSVRCSMCGEYFGEAFGRVKEGEIVCIPCFEGE